MENQPTSPSLRWSLEGRDRKGPRRARRAALRPTVAHRLSIATGLLLACAACDDDNPFRGEIDIRSEVSTERAVVFNDVGRDELRFVSPRERDGSLEVFARRIGDERDVVAWIRPTRDRTQLLALNVPADEKQEEVEETLLRFPADGEGDPVSYEVRAPFDNAALTPDHRRAVLYFGGSGQGPLSNANQVAICELGSDMVRSFTLNGFGGRLEQVQFPGQLVEGESSPVQIGGVSRDLVAFLAQGEVVLVDMDDPAANQVAINFRNGGLVGTPSATLLRAGNDRFGDPVLFVRSPTDSDVAALTLLEKANPEGGTAGFTAQVGLVDGGPQITDFVAYDGEDIPYLITVNSNGLRFTDIRTFDSFDVAVEGQVQRIFLRDAEKGGRTIKQAVLWRAGANAIYTLDLDDIESTVGRKPRPLAIQSGVRDVIPLDNDRLLVGSVGFLYVLDLPLEQVTPLSTSVDYDPSFSRLVGDTLLLGAPGSTYVSSVDLRDLNPETMVLDYTTERLHYLDRSRKIVAMHAADAGLATVVDADDPARSTARVSWGFFLEGVLDRD